MRRVCPCRLTRILERALGTEVARCPPATVCPAFSETPALLCRGSLRGVERGSLGLEEDAAAAGEENGLLGIYLHTYDLRAPDFTVDQCKHWADLRM